jgi:hypothetical protein
MNDCEGAMRHLLVVLLLALIAREVQADISCKNSTFPAFLVGNSSGVAIRLAGQSEDGFVVIVRDENGNPLANEYVSIWFAASYLVDPHTAQNSGTDIDCDPGPGPMIGKYTDSNGKAVFAPRIGGHTENDYVGLYLGENVGPPCAFLKTRSTDIDRDGDTDFVDYGLFSTGYGSGLHPPHCDFNGDGQVGLIDLSIFTEEFNRSPDGTLCHP